MDTSKVAISNPLVSKLIAATFPEYTGRKVRVTVADFVSLGGNYWDGGTRYFKAFVGIDTLQARVLPSNHPIMERGRLGARNEQVPLIPNAVMVEHTIFQGEDCGITLYVHPMNRARLLPIDNPVMVS